MSVPKFKICVLFDVEEVLPKGSIPTNDSFSFSIRFQKKCLNELFPISNILIFQIDDPSKSCNFIVKVSKGPLTVFSGDFEISKLVFLNKESSFTRSFALTPVQSNKKLISVLTEIASLKVELKVKIAYNEKDFNLFMASKPSKAPSNLKFHNYSMTEKKTDDFNQRGLNLRKAEEHNVARDSIINADDIKFINKLEKDESSFIDSELNDSKEDEKKIINFEGEQSKFSNLMSDMTNAVANFENLPCTKFSKAIAEKFFKFQSCYYKHYESYSIKYHKLRKLMNKYNEKYRLYTKMLSKLKASLREIDDRLTFQNYISRSEKTNILGQREIMRKQLNLFRTIMKLDGDEQDQAYLEQPIQNKSLSSEKDTLKAVLESLAKKPDLLTKIHSKLFPILKEHSLKFGVKMEIPAEWIIDKIEEVPEASILSSEKEELHCIKSC